MGLSGSDASLSSDKGIRIIGIIGVLAGVFVILTIVGDLIIPTPSTPSQQLSTFNANQAAYAFSWGADAVAYTFGIAFVGGFSRIVRKKSPSVSTAAAMLVVASQLFLIISKSLIVGPLFAISSAPQTAANASYAMYLATIVSGLEYQWLFVAFLLAGVGLVLFGWLIWEGEIFPRWLSRVLLVTGILVFVPPITDILPSAFFLLGAISLLAADVLELVFFFEAGMVLLRRKPTVAEAAK